MMESELHGLLSLYENTTSFYIILVRSVIPDKPSLLKINKCFNPIPTNKDFIRVVLKKQLFRHAGNQPCFNMYLKIIHT